MTDLQTSNEAIADVIRLSDTKYFTIQELEDRIESGELDYCPTKCYIREKLEKGSQFYKTNLTTFDFTSKKKFFQIIKPITIFKRGGKEYLANGNSRVVNILEMYADASDEDKKLFIDVPYNYILNENPSDELLYYFQNVSNDQTRAHKLLQKLKKASSIYEENLAYYKKLEDKNLIEELSDADKKEFDEANLQEDEKKYKAVDGELYYKAKAKARKAVLLVMGVGQAQTAKILEVATEADKSPLFTSFIEHEQINIGTAYKMVIAWRKLKKKDISLSLDFVILSLKNLAELNDSKNKEGLTLITPRFIDIYLESLKTPVVKETKAPESKYTTIADMQNDGRFTEESATHAAEVKEHYGDLLDEQKFVNALAKTEGVLTVEDIENVIKKINPEGKQVTFADVKNTRKQLSSSLEIVSEKNDNEPIDKDEKTNIIAKFNTEALKLILKTNKLFDTSTNKELFDTLLNVVSERVSSLDDVLDGQDSAYYEVNGILENLTKLSDKLVAEKKAKSKKTETETETVEVTSEDIDVDDDADADAEIFEDGYEEDKE